MVSPLVMVTFDAAIIVPFGPTIDKVTVAAGLGLTVVVDVFGGAVAAVELLVVAAGFVVVAVAAGLLLAEDFAFVGLLDGFATAFLVFCALVLCACDGA